MSFIKSSICLTLTCEGNLEPPQPPVSRRSSGAPIRLRGLCRNGGVPARKPDSQDHNLYNPRGCIQPQRLTQLHPQGVVSGQNNLTVVQPPQGLSNAPSAQAFSELIVAQKCELITLSASAFSPFYSLCSHTATFPYFSLLLPNSYRILMLSRSHHTASTYCHFLVSLTVQPQTPILSLSPFQSCYLY